MTLAQAKLLADAFLEGKIHYTLLLTDEDRQEIHKLNEKNGYTMEYEEFIKLVDMHKASRENDAHIMAMIEYRLADLNFHSEVKMLRAGKYDGAKLCFYL